MSSVRRLLMLCQSGEDGGDEEGGATLLDVASAVRLLDLRAGAGVTTSTAGFNGTGTIGQVGDTITGVGTSFLSEVVVGDRVTSALSTTDGIVTAVADDTSLTLDTSAVVGGGLSFTITPQASTARITSWENAGTLGGSFTQSGSARPSKQTGGGVSFIFFDGEDDCLVGPNIADDLDSFAVFAVFVQTNLIDPPSANGGGAAFLSKMDDYGAGAGWFVTTPGAFGTVYTQEDGGSVFAELDTNTYDQSNLDASFVYAVEVISRNTFTTYINGTQVTGDLSDGGSPVADMSNSAPLRIGLRVPSSYMKMPLSALLAYAPAPNASDRAAIEGWLAAEFGV